MNRRSFSLAWVAVACVSGAAGAQPAEGEAAAAAEPAADEPAAAEAGATDAAPSTATRTVDSAPAPLGDAVTASTKFTFEPFGYLRVQYILVQNDPNVAHIGRDDGFEMQNARIGVRGSYAQRVRYVIAVDGAVDERAQPNTPQGTLRVALRDAFADVMLGGKVFARGGFFQTWTDPQRLIPDTVREFVDRPIESRGMRSTEGWHAPGLPPGRSIGGALRLEPERAGQLGFELAVQNGADEFASNNDNDLPAVSVAALLRLADDGFLVASGRWNPRTEGQLPFRQDETDLQGALGAQLNAGALRFGAAGIVQRTTFPSTGGPVQNAFGAHAQVAFKVPASSPVYLGYRFGILDPSSLIVSDRVMEHTAGGAIAVPSLRMRLQLQATHVMEQAARELSNTRVQLAAEVTL